MKNSHIESNSSARVLVVDDDITSRLLAQQSLAHEGFTVLEAEDGLQALAVFRDARPNVVLMDVEMPGLNGFDTCRRLRSLPTGKTVPILMVTGLDDIDSIEKAYEAGATDFTSKPINWLILSRRLRYVLRASATFEDLKTSERLLANAQRIARLGNWEWDLRSNALLWSQQFYRLLGLEPQSIEPSFEALLARVHPEDRLRVQTWLTKVRNNEDPGSINHRIVLPDGTECIVQKQAEVLFDEASESEFVSGTIQDITQLKRAEEQIQHMAYYDSLTGLANRWLFQDRVRQTLLLAERHNALAVILFLDLDEFKRINDTLGHAIGDLLLKETSERLTVSLRRSDSVIRLGAQELNQQVARLGGDEFTVLLSEVQQISDVAMVAQRILDSMSHSINLDGHELVVTASIGIAVFPHDGKDVDILLRNADTAMYHAKSNGKNQYQFFAEFMNEAAMRRLQMEMNLRKALERKELFLHYQPQIDLWNGLPSGVEALLRWNNDELGPIETDEFIPLAEETGLIIPIGDWVLEQACAQVKLWQSQGNPELRVAVNISARQFSEGNLPAKVARTLEKTGLSPQYLELEITESLLMRDVEEAIETLNKLKSLGVTIAIDDFGTGYSSLSYLKRFPIDRLKIDRSFVSNIISDPNDAAVALAVVSLAHSLKMKVTAEGVEAEAQQTFLKERLCDEVQGFYISYPMLPSEISELLKQTDNWLKPKKNKKPKQRTLLLVDDDTYFTQLLELKLHSEGYRILIADKPSEAFDILARQAIDVVVADEIMPELAGTEFLSRVKDLYPRTVRIVLSGKSNLDSLTKAINNGAIFKFLPKPIDDTILRTTLREAFLLHDQAQD